MALQRDEQLRSQFVSDVSVYNPDIKTAHTLCRSTPFYLLLLIIFITRKYPPL